MARGMAPWAPLPLLGCLLLPVVTGSQPGAQRPLCTWHRNGVPLTQAAALSPAVAPGSPQVPHPLSLPEPCRALGASLAQPGPAARSIRPLPSHWFSLRLAWPRGAPPHRWPTDSSRASGLSAEAQARARRGGARCRPPEDAGARGSVGPGHPTVCSRDQQKGGGVWADGGERWALEMGSVGAEQLRPWGQAGGKEGLVPAHGPTAAWVSLI